MDQHRPRSILKHSSATIPIPKPTRAPSVRFPSTPKLSTVHYTHCPVAYDRSPIVVLPNSCAIPERNCRLYSSSSSPPQNLNWGKEAHPSIILTPTPSSACSPDSHYSESALVPPPLMHDEGSSEESDGLASPPPELALSLPTAHSSLPSQSHLHSAPFSHPPIRNLDRSASSPAIMTNAGPSDYSLSFLPHPPHKKRHHHAALPAPALTAPTFRSSWQDTDESSCLGGF